ncbi:hypothetical protein DEJ50_22065 [Streptomyces venezuelae]|uniref:Uncharacterized protein n=2 Tax=Streptomyces venezuelae TaxID=54571 RepID=A0A5P2D4M5_STRVZ|nr:hypothetical protein DEJ50_22065 [Streptomyces venezuelae]
MLATTTLVVTGLVWLSHSLQRERRTEDRTAVKLQRELRSEVAELSSRVGAMQRLLEGLD